MNGIIIFVYSVFNRFYGHAINFNRLLSITFIHVSINKLYIFRNTTYV